MSVAPSQPMAAWNVSTASPPAASDARRTPPRRQRAYQRVLLVDDAPTFRTVVGRNLRSRGFTVCEAGTVAEALAVLRADPPDLLLLDIDLPDRTGWDVLRDLAAVGQQVPTIVVSAVRVNPAQIAEFRPLAYLPKPFPIDALVRLLEREPTAAEHDPA